MIKQLLSKLGSRVMCEHGELRLVWLRFKEVLVLLFGIICTSEIFTALFVYDSFNYSSIHFCIDSLALAQFSPLIINKLLKGSYWSKTSRFAMVGGGCLLYAVLFLFFSDFCRYYFQIRTRDLLVTRSFISKLLLYENKTTSSKVSFIR